MNELKNNMHKAMPATALVLAMIMAACAESPSGASRSAAAVRPINPNLITPPSTVGSTVGTGATLPDVAGGRGGR